MKSSKLKFWKTIVPLLFILPFIVPMYSCSDYDKNSSEKTEQINTNSTDKPYNTKLEESSPSSDFKFNTVSYQIPQENFSFQDKRMIIRSGTMNLESEDFDETEKNIREIVSRFNGYITNSSSQLNAAGKKQGSLTLRVPSSEFDNLILSLGSAGKVMSINITGKDVSEEYMDAEARLKTQRELESRLLKLLQEKTANLTSIVEVEGKLAQVRESIEKNEGRMRYLRDQAAYSTLVVSVYETSMLSTSSGGGFFHEIGESISKGLTGFTKVVSGFITFIIAVSPVLAFAGIMVYFIIRYIRKRKAANAQA